MSQNINSQFSVLNTINQVDGFDPSQLTVDYVDLTTQEKRKRLPVMAQLAWFRLRHPEGKIALHVEPVKDYKIVDALFTCLLQERQFGIPADEKLKKQRATALGNLQTVITSFRKQFQSFAPTTPEAYRDAISKMVNTVLPAWLQYRFTYIPF